MNVALSFEVSSRERLPARVMGSLQRGDGGGHQGQDAEVFRTCGRGRSRRRSWAEAARSVPGPGAHDHPPPKYLPSPRAGVLATVFNLPADRSAPFLSVGPRPSTAPRQHPPHAQGFHPRSSSAPFRAQNNQACRHVIAEGRLSIPAPPICFPSLIRATAWPSRRCAEG